MLELVRLVLATLVAAARSRQGLVVENLLVRQQLQDRFVENASRLLVSWPRRLPAKEPRRGLLRLLAKALA
jgi:hypothetical protein